MTSPRSGTGRRSALGRLVLALAVVATLMVGTVPAQSFAFAATGAVAGPTGDMAALSAWDGSVNLYRTGVFTTQKTWYYCTAADVQIIRNIVRHEEDHSRAGQDRYFSYMRKHMRYDIPVKAGVDPAGWTAGMRQFVDDRYRLVRSDTFKALIRSAVRSLRRTNLPVPLFVDHGNHGWVLHGFTATADPAVTSDFKVTSVRVTGPLWGRQSSTYGYDMKPNKKLTRAQLRDFVTRWHYAPIRMVYEGEFLSIQPIAALTTTAAATTTAPATTTTAGPAPIASPSQDPATGDAAASTMAALAPEPTTGSVAPSAAGGREAPTPGPMAAVVGPGPPGGSERYGSFRPLLILATGAGLLAAIVIGRRRSARRG